MSDEAEVIFDSLGNVYAIDEGKLLIPNKKVSISCFEFPKSVSKNVERLGYDKGFRVDPHNL